jgi:hypothetical protein
LIHYHLRIGMPRRKESALADDYSLTTRDIRYIDDDIERSKRYVKNVKAEMEESARVMQVLQNDLRNLTQSAPHGMLHDLVIIPQIREVEAEITLQEQHYDALLDRAMFIHEQHRSLLRRRKVLFDSLGY